MTTTLRTRLAELADDAPLGGPDATLWARGRRLSRRRRTGSAVIVATVALVLSVMGAWSWERSPQPPAPAGSGDGLRLPNQFFVPGERTDGTDDAGPLGPVTAVLRAPRDGEGSGLAGISSSTGEYRFLDLPGWAQDDPVSLAADGVRIAYWDGDGVAVYDTASGEVTRHPVESEHGGPLVLVGDEVWFESGDAVAAWKIGGDVVRTWEPSRGRVPALDDATIADDSLVVEGSGHEVRVWSSADARPEVRHTTRRLGGPVWRMPTEDAYAAGGGSRTAVLMTATAPGRFHTAVVHDFGIDAVAGWREDFELVVLYDGRYSRVPLETMSPHELTRAPAGDVDLQVAADAWRGPVYRAQEPPDPRSPWVLRGAAGGVVVAGAAALLWWRRRARA